MRYNLDPLEALFQPTYPQTLRYIATSLFMALLDTSADLPKNPNRAHRLAVLVLSGANRLSRDFGGNQLYIPVWRNSHQTTINTVAE